MYFLPEYQNLFLRAINKAPQNKVKDFDWPPFRKGVAELFGAEGWLKAV